MALPTVPATAPPRPAAAPVRQALATPDGGLPDSIPMPRSEGGGFGVQLGAYATQAEADRNWQEMRTRRPNLFLGLRPMIQESPVVKGTQLARLMIGPFENEGSAIELCTRFRSVGQDCTVRRLP
jgi:cell division protein FtsN